jgi:hypothetical protein
LSGLADCVHDLAKQFLVGDIVACLGIPGALDYLTAKALNLVGSHTAKVVVKRIARFELFAVDEERIGAGERVAGGLVEVAEEFKTTILQGRSAVFVLPVKA